MQHIQFFLANGSWWLFLALAGVCASLAWIAYRKTTPMLPGGLRLTLGTLRTIGLCMLLIALFEPVMRYVSSLEQRPPILLAVDASSSMALKDGGGDRSKYLYQAITTVNELIPDVVRVVFSDVTTEVSTLDSVNLNGNRTDFEQLIRTVSNRRGMERPGAVIVISDGNVNSGTSPLYDAERSGIGWYTIGIGDTNVPRDVGLVNLISGGLAVVGRTSVISATVQANEYADSAVVVTLYEEGVAVASDTVRINHRRFKQMVNLSWTPRVSGHRKVTVRTSTLTNDAISANNQLSDYVQVKSDEQVVYIFAGAPSPDLTFIKTQLETSPTTKVKILIQKQGGEFYEGLPSIADLTSAQACILIGFPIASTPVGILQRIEQACKNGTSVFFIAGHETDYTKVKLLEEVLPFTTTSSRNTETLITADVASAHTADPLMRIDGTSTDNETWNGLPPIYRTETYVTPKSGAEVLATIRINNVPVPEPLIIRQSNGAMRSVAVLGYGLYRWKLMGKGPAASRGEVVADAFASFMSNGIAWLAADDKDKKVRVTTNRKFYASGEHVMFQASVLDDVYSAVDGAEVAVTYTGPKGATRIVLAGLGNGRYASNVGALPSGDYSFSATASLNGKGLGTDAGRFSVGELGLEASGTTQNVELLRALAERTKARYATVSDAERMLREALKDPRLRTKAVTTEKDQALWWLPWPLMVSIAAFAIEWVIRRRVGLV